MAPTLGTAAARRVAPASHGRERLSARDHPCDVGEGRDDPGGHVGENGPVRKVLSDGLRLVLRRTEPPAAPGRRGLVFDAALACILGIVATADAWNDAAGAPATVTVDY